MADASIIPLNQPELIELLKRMAALVPNIPDLSQVALRSDIPTPPDLTRFALEADLAKLAASVPGVPDLSGYALKTQVPVFLPNTYTIAQLLALDPTQYAYQYARCSDLFGVGDVMLSDGTNWKPVRPFSVQTQDATKAAILTTLKHAPTQLFAGTMIANVTVSISTQYAYRGARFRVVRTAAGTLYNLVVNGLNLALNQWTDFEYDGTSFVKTASGGLLG